MSLRFGKVKLCKENFWKGSDSLKVQIFLKVSNDHILIEELETVIMGEKIIKIDNKSKLSSIPLNHGELYAFVGKNRALTIDGNEIFYLITEKD